LSTPALPQFPDYAFVLALLWLAAVIAASVIYRRTRGKPIFPRSPADAVYVARWSSGRSHKNILTQLGGANSCLLVCVTPIEFSVVPMFPFNLMFLPEIYDLEHYLELSHVEQAEIYKSAFREWVQVTLPRSNGRSTTIDLRVPRQEEFVALLRARRRRLV
jgi:hypothetical protein